MQVGKYQRQAEEPLAIHLVITYLDLFIKNEGAALIWRSLTETLFFIVWSYPVK